MVDIVIPLESHVIIATTPASRNINSNNIKSYKHKVGDTKTHFKICNDYVLYKSLSMSIINKNTNGVLSGGTYINNVDTVFESGVDLYQNGYKIDTSITTDGKFKFKYLNPSYVYDVKATPLNTDFNPRIVPNLKPVIDNSSFKFLFYCHYDKKYKSGKPYTIRTVAYDTRGTLKFNLDGAPIGMTIDEKTGVISFNLSTIDTYNFTVNCSDSLLEVTKSIPMEIEIIA